MTNALDYRELDYINDALELQKKFIKNRLKNIKNPDEGDIEYAKQETEKINSLQNKLSTMQSEWLKKHVPNPGNHLNYTDE